MYEYFTVLLKENSNDNLKLLNDKMNAGFTVDNQITVGKSTVVTLRKRAEPRVNTNLTYETDAAIPMLSGSVLTARG